MVYFGNFDNAHVTLVKFKIKNLQSLLYLSFQSFRNPMDFRRIIFHLIPTLCEKNSFQKNKTFSLNILDT